MADAVTTQVLSEGKSRVVLKFTNVSDGTGESAVAKAAIATYNCNGFSIEKVHYVTSGMAVDILWDATSDVLCWRVPADAAGTFDFSNYPIPNNAGAGVTGSINFTTVGHTLNDTYTIILELRKS